MIIFENYKGGREILMIKNNKGITLIILVITVIVMSIIAGATIYSGTKEIEKSTENKQLSELKIVNQAVYEAYAHYNKTKDSTYIVGEALNQNEIDSLISKLGINLIEIPNTYDNLLRCYYRLTPITLENIGIYKSKDSYVVNYLTRRSNK